MTPGASFTCAGKKVTASNQHYFTDLDPVGNEVMEPFTCNKTRLNYCDVALVKVSNPVPADDADGKLKKNIPDAGWQVRPDPGSCHGLRPRGLRR